MDEVPAPDDLRGAGRVAQALAYVAGLAGAIGGTVVLQRGETVIAVVVWVLTFAAGGVLMIAAVLVRAMAGLLGRLAQMESDLRVLVADRGHDGGLRPPGEPDRWP